MAMRTKSALPLWREVVNESWAGITDCLATCFCVALSYGLFFHVDPIKDYFESVKHVYWVFYFIHVGLIDRHIWAGTFRNSALYIYSRGHSQSRFRTLLVILSQYISIFLGAWMSCKVVEYVFASDELLQSRLKYYFVGSPDFTLDWTTDDYYLFIWQTIAFQLVDRCIAGTAVTISPLLRRYTSILDGSWMVVTWRCLFAHYLITNHRYSLVVNPNYTFYDCLYHWRWSRRDLLVLTLPYLCILIWTRTFDHLPFLFNPSYFDSKMHAVSEGKAKSLAATATAKGRAKRRRNRKSKNAGTKSGKKKTH